MTREIAEAIANGPGTTPVVCLEEDRVWVSGMNSRPWVRARRIAARIREAGFETGDVTDDGAAEHGGLLIPVEGCEPISDEVREEVFYDAPEQ